MTLLCFVLVLVASTCAQEVPQPLPQADTRIVEHFQVALEAVFGVGIRLQAFLQDERDENFLVSPISATVIIGQLVLGTEGEFRKQLVELLALPNTHNYEHETINYYNSNSKKNVSYYLPYTTLHLQLSNLLRALEGAQGQHFTLKEKSALFVDDKTKLNDTFAKGLMSLYNTKIFPLDFVGNPLATQKTVNSWAEKHTNGLIKTILQAPPTPTTSSIFANAIYFKADWEMPFSDMLNRPGYFNVSASKQVKVTFMVNQLDQIFYSESQDYRMIALPYTNEDLGFYIMLPRPNSTYKYDMKKFVENLKSREVLDTISRGRRRDVVVKLPKMQLSNSFSILEQLKKYRSFKKQNIRVKSTNVVDKLEDRVDAFSNFTSFDDRDLFLTTAAVGKNLRIGDIVQQVVISVNEKGTEAAAVAAATIDYMGGAKNFLVDRPFVFFIRHEATSATLFWGTVANPTA